jgi:hypothetical protein
MPVLMRNGKPVAFPIISHCNEWAVRVYLIRCYYAVSHVYLIINVVLKQYRFGRCVLDNCGSIGLEGVYWIIVAQ